MRSQSKGIGSADIDASMCHKIRTIPALLHCASHWQDKALIMVSATPFCFCTTQKYLAVKRIRSSMT